MLQRITGVVVLLSSLTLLAVASAGARSSRVIDDNDTVILHGNVHPHARTDADMGPADSSLPMERMVLALLPSPDRLAELERFNAELQDPSSSVYHQWLTPAEFGERFGPSADDVAAVTGWLSSHGFTVEEVAAGRMWINFTGSAAQVNVAFRTSIHDYYVNGRVHHANTWDPSIPKGLADLVAGPVALHSFPRNPMNTGIRPLTPVGLKPEYTSGSSHYLSPADFAAIYSVNSLYAAGIDGTGQSIAIVGRTHPSITNWTTFRSLMGLPANPPQVIVNGADPGDLGAGEDGEADLDVEWSGAVAKNATIKFVTSKSTNTTDGVDLSAQYIVNNNLTPVMSVSFGQCESQMGTAENTFFNNLWSQAAAQGITVFVSSGDSGVAGCSSGSATTGSGAGINGLSSTPYNVAVGGTQLNEGSGSYWSTTNGPGYSSTLGYIPEAAWNESGTVSGGSGLWATGGGVSTHYAKPSWQKSPGVPADGKRDVPDVSLSASGHDAYLVQTQGTLSAIGGTSASSPSFAGLMALIVQKTGQRQGNANLRFYQLANAQYGGSGPAVFNDIIDGGNSVPGVPGFTCNAGYDPVTGLGSVNANALVTNWNGSASPDFTITASPAQLSVSQGGTGAATLTTTVSGGFSSSITFTASGLPTGATAAFAPVSIAAPGAGSPTITITTANATPAGSYAVTISAAGGGIIKTAILTLTVTTASSTVQLFSDGFEASGWVSSQLVGVGGKWTLTGSGLYPLVSPHSGARLAALNSYASAKGSKTRLHHTAGISLPATYSAVTLRFWMYHDTGYPTYADQTRAQVSTNKITWNNVGPAILRNDGTTGWTQVSIDLSAYRGKTVYLGFVGISASGNNIYLDDVEISGQ